MLVSLGATVPAFADGPGGQVPPTGPVGGGNRIGASATYQVHLSGDLRGGSGSISVGGLLANAFWMAVGINSLGVLVRAAVWRPESS